ncbi:aldehyde dehydrogenase family protein [Micrococcales bacterium 31B]|nr:aldehyde dehydrogenase family protein [Micrococcales bacterium 31B]
MTPRAPRKAAAAADQPKRAATQQRATPASKNAAPGAARVGVRKTYKLFIGGAFPRSESGRSYMVKDASGASLANAAQGSRKDARDAVVAARAAFSGWSQRTAYNRSQILYRIAEMLEDRREQFAAAVAAGEGCSRDAAAGQVSAAIDRMVWYAGWPDKLAQVLGATNPVQGPYFNVSTPQPTGVVAVIAPAASSLLGLVSVVAPALAAGNTVVVVASGERPLPAINLAEALATSDVPGGVVNILTGDYREIAPTLAAHMDVNALDLTGVSDASLARDCEVAAVENVKRCLRPGAFGDDDFERVPGIRRMEALLETRTVWHPVGV